MTRDTNIPPTRVDLTKIVKTNLKFSKKIIKISSVLNYSQNTGQMPQTACFRNERRFFVTDGSDFVSLSPLRGLAKPAAAYFATLRICRAVAALRIERRSRVCAVGKSFCVYGAAAGNCIEKFIELCYHVLVSSRPHKARAVKLPASRLLWINGIKDSWTCANSFPRGPVVRAAVVPWAQSSPKTSAFSPRDTTARPPAFSTAATKVSVCATNWAFPAARNTRNVTRCTPNQNTVAVHSLISHTFFDSSHLKYSLHFDS